MVDQRENKRGVRGYGGKKNLKTRPIASYRPNVRVRRRQTAPTRNNNDRSTTTSLLIIIITDIHLVVFELRFGESHRLVAHSVAAARGAATRRAVMNLREDP